MAESAELLCGDDDDDNDICEGDNDYESLRSILYLFTLSLSILDIDYKVRITKQTNKQTKKTQTIN
jgi:hypothetical protein